MTQPPSWLSLLALEPRAQAAGWRGWGGRTRAAAAALCGTLLPAPRAARRPSGCLEAAVTSQAAWLELERWSLLNPGMGAPGLWEDGCFSEGCLPSLLFWPVPSHSAAALLGIVP